MLPISATELATPLTAALFPTLGPTELLMVLGAVLLLFGGKKLPELARGLGQGIKEFKHATREGLGEDDEDEDEEPPAKKTSTKKRQASEETEDEDANEELVVKA